MNISKIGSIFAFVTGGWSGLATYVLEAVNKWLATLDQARLYQFAQVVKCVSAAVTALAPLLPEKYSRPVKTTVAAIDTLSASLADGKVEKDELDKCIDALECAIDAWKEAAE